MIYFCAQRNRRTLVLARPPLSGIDYLEIADATDQTVLLLTFLRPPGSLALMPANVVILGGESVTDIRVIRLQAEPLAPNTLRVTVDRAGDFSGYTLALIANVTTDEPPPGVDPALAQIAFSFKAGCPATGDCEPVSCCPAPAVDEPEINYLAKDFPAFVQVMLDRMAVLVPTWKERHAADVGVALVETLAYVADHLSYRQDAVATEAYLGTCRSRISLRRHARLVDYRVDEGENARVWAHVRCTAEGVALAQGTLLLPRVAGVATRLAPASAAARNLLAENGAAFATLVPATLSASVNDLRFYTWGDTNCCLAAGATQATLTGHLIALNVGDVLLFEEVRGPLTGAAEDADRTRRCVVRLTRVHHTDRLGQALTDPVSAAQVTGIEWDAADALPFALCISSVTDAEHGSRAISNVSIAHGNMVPADHGRWIDSWQALGVVPDAPPAPVASAGGCCVAIAPVVARPPEFFPALTATPLTFTRPYDPGTPASALTRAATPDTPLPAPQITVRDDHNNVWSPEGDLLGLDPLQRGFVVETERDAIAYLRFGDGEHGTAPSPGDAFRARYRIGNGSAGNIGSDTLGHVLTPETRVVSVRNPLPGGGGRDPETMESVRQRAPWAFRTQQRAVTEDDYGVAALRDAAIRAARGTLRWTGSWRTAFVAVDPALGAPPPTELAEATLQRLELLRMAGVDTGAEPAFIVGLRVALSICVKPRYARGQVLQALQGVFTAGPGCNGGPGLLDPGNFSFGQTVYLSPFIAAAQAVEGVASVQATAFQRVDDPARDAVTRGFITMQRLEIARIDNDPSRPDRGIFELTLDGGL